MKKILAVILVTILAISLIGCGAGNAAAAEKSKLQQVLERGHLIVGTGSDNVPWSFMDESGKLIGFDIDMARILAKGIFGDPDKVEFVVMSADARIPNLLTDKVDIVLQFMTISPQRLQMVAFSIPYYTEGMGLILPKNGKYKNYQEMVAAQQSGEIITIAILQNVYSADMVQLILKGAKDAQYQGTAILYQVISSGRADAAAIDLSSIMWLASKQPDKYLDAGISFYPFNYGAAMRPDDQEWINYVNSVFLDALTGKTYLLYNDAYEKWFGKKLPAPTVGKPAMYR